MPDLLADVARLQRIRDWRRGVLHARSAFVVYNSVALPRHDLIGIFIDPMHGYRDAVLDGAPVLTDPADSVANMAVIDAVYAAAGLPVRP